MHENKKPRYPSRRGDGFGGSYTVDMTLQSVAGLAGYAHQAEDNLAAVLAGGVELSARLEVRLRAHVGGVAVFAGGGVESSRGHRPRVGTVGTHRTGSVSARPILQRN